MSDLIANEKLADNVLLYIRKKEGHFYSVSSLAKRFDTDISAIIDAYNRLKELGYRIDKNKNSEISFIEAADSLTSDEILYNLKTKFIGKYCHSFNRIKSTNDIASGLAEKGAEEGTIITAEEQTKGRGRLGRIWHSPPKCGIYVSIILRPKFKPEHAPGISIMAAVALADAISEYLPEKVKIKWPNDIILASKKTAGILTELSAEKNKINFLIVGIGINVNQTTGMFHEDIRKLATSIRRVLRRKLNRVELLNKFLINFEREYIIYNKQYLKKSLNKIRDYSSLLNNQISLRLGNRTIHGIARDIDQTGALIVETSDGEITVTSGEVTILK